MMKRLGVLVYVVMASAVLARAEEGKTAALASLQGMAGVTAAAESTKSLPGVAVGEAAAAMPTVFTGGSRWTGSSGFDPLEVLGVQGDAENKALAKCQAEGFLNCVVTGSHITSCDSYTCEASATARDLETAANAQFETVNHSSRFTTNGHFSTLEQIGVVKSARDKARAACQQKGLLDCVVIGGAIDSCNYRNDEYQFECNASATARGRK
jgi:hypothetical protein